MCVCMCVYVCMCVCVCVCASVYMYLFHNAHASIIETKLRLRIYLPLAPPHVTGPDTCSVPLLVSCFQPPFLPSVVFPSLANQHTIAVTKLRQHIV